MINDDQEELVQELRRFVKARQHYAKEPKRIAELVSRLMSRKAYAQMQTSDQRESAWARVVGTELASVCRVGNVRRGVLEVFVTSSVAIQELTFQKKRFVKMMVMELPDLKMHDIRFRVDEPS